MAKLLVTGGAGFIGANFVHYWLARHPGDRVVVLDALTYAGNLANLEPARQRPEYRFIEGDIRDTALVEQLLREESLDTIVHFAAESHVDRSIEGPDAFIETNVIGTHSLLKAARRVWLEGPGVLPHRFHHVSTDEVYGSLGPTDPPFTELTPYAPNSPYSASKAASDHLVRAYHHTYGLKTSISNCSNNYGPHQFPEKLIPLMIAQLLAGKSLPVYGDGRNVRDWLHVEDHCRGIEAVLGQGRAGEVYNIGGGSECENIQLVRMLCSIVDAHLLSTQELCGRFPNSAAAQGEQSERLVRYVKDRPGHDRRYAIDSAKIQRDLGYRPQVALEAGLRSTVAWYLDRADSLRTGWQRTLT
ncbi:MAG: dTDP-glucose 4,6-dehydratase [Steroidobacteraceae bacterium]|jgi:dTDP-glucose 4,6-dehydratase